MLTRPVNATLLQDVIRVVSLTYQSVAIVWLSHAPMTISGIILQSAKATYKYIQFERNRLIDVATNLPIRR